MNYIFISIPAIGVALCIIALLNMRENKNDNLDSQSDSKNKLYSQNDEYEYGHNVEHDSKTD